MKRKLHIPRATSVSVASAIAHCARALRKARVCFGHGTHNARDEAAELVFFVAKLDHALGASVYPQLLTARQQARIEALLAQRIRRRVPLAYLTHRAFFAQMELYVDSRVLVPRSPIAELALARFRPWIEPRRVKCIVDIGTGSGAIALACARAFPRAQVDALDISREALSVCRRNIRKLGLGGRVHAKVSDHLDAVAGTVYDIVVSNPPYVGRAEMRTLPREYRHEPRLGLAAGLDGLDSVRVILRQARAHLSAIGILVVEVGNTERALLKAWPRVPFIWPDFEHGGGGVFILRAQDLEPIEELSERVRK